MRVVFEPSHAFGNRGCGCGYGSKYARGRTDEKPTATRRRTSRRPLYWLVSSVRPGQLARSTVGVLASNRVRGTWVVVWYSFETIARHSKLPQCAPNWRVRTGYNINLTPVRRRETRPGHAVIFCYSAILSGWVHLKKGVPNLSDKRNTFRSVYRVSRYFIFNRSFFVFIFI